MITFTPINIPERQHETDKWCCWCWKWHPVDTVGRYDKDNNFVCSNCVLDCYTFGALVGKTWQETKAHWGFRKG